MATVVSDATAAMTTIKSSSMVVNMLRTALYTVTYCRGTRVGWTVRVSDVARASTDALNGVMRARRDI